MAKLIKIRIALLNTLAALAGYRVAGGLFSLKMGVFLLAVFSLCAGAAALNQVQERELDARMRRTRNRPLPAGNLTLKQGLVIALGAVFLGISLLWGIFGGWSAGIGILTLIMYNFVYTSLKRKSPFASIPGALVGALVPVLGWVSAAGIGLSDQILFVALFIFIWQIPHFWLYYLMHAADYQASGLPTLMDVLGKSQIQRILISWLGASVAAVGLFPLVGLFLMPWVYYLVLGLGILLVFTGLIRLGRRIQPVFSCLNGFAALILLLIIVEGV